MKQTGAIWDGLAMCDHVYNKMIEQAAARHGMVKVELDVLLFLHNNPGFDTARDICERRNIAKSYVSKAVDLLRGKQMIALAPSKSDRRINHLHLLPCATDAIASGLAVQAQFERQLWENIDHIQRLAVAQTLEQMRENLRSLL